ncbi:MAG: GatB/YqeY domain-containing protein [Candidatus Doudnabacteria bacterium]
MLKEQIDADLKAAMIAKDQTTLDTLRMLRARIKNEEIAKGKDFADEEIVSVIGSEVKKRKDSVTAYTEGNRPELAEKEQSEITVLQKYLPAQLSEQEVTEIITEALVGQTFQASEFGKAMALVMPKLKGKADGSLISKILKEKLS